MFNKLTKTSHSFLTRVHFTHVIYHKVIIIWYIDVYQYLKGNSLSSRVRLFLFPGNCIFNPIFLHDESKEINQYYLTSEKTDQTAKSCAKQIDIYNHGQNV